jgi:hypothetical protein
MNVTPNIPGKCLNSRQMIPTDKAMSLIPIKDDPTLKRIAVLSYN